MTEDYFSRVLCSVSPSVPQQKNFSQTNCTAARGKTRGQRRNGQPARALLLVLCPLSLERGGHAASAALAQALLCRLRAPRAPVPQRGAPPARSVERAPAPPFHGPVSLAPRSLHPPSLKGWERKKSRSLLMIKYDFLILHK